MASIVISGGRVVPDDFSLAEHLHTCVISSLLVVSVVVIGLRLHLLSSVIKISP